MQGLLTSRWSAHRTPSLNQRYFRIPANRCATTAVAVQTRLWMSGKQRPLPRPIPPAPASSPQTTNSDDGGCENTKMLCMRGEGLINRKELHGTVSISALSGNWALQKAGVTLQGYKLSFTCNKIDEKYSNFILLIDAVLDNDVACVDMNLFIVEKMVKAVVSPCGPIHLEAEQVEQAKRFHELFFNGVYGSLSRDSRSSGLPRQFLLLEDDSSLWNSSNMYLLLPVETEFAEDSDCIRINWKAIHEAASAFEIFRCRNMPSADSCSNSRYEASLVFESSAVGTNFCKLEVIHLANTTAEPQTLKDMITIAIHTGKIYSIVEVVSGSSSHNRLNKSSDGATYAEYFLTKYKIVLLHPEQPLLLVKSGHTPYNLLSSNLNFPGNSVSKKSGHASAHVKRIPKDLYMPPELLIHINVPPAVLKSLYLLPSLMYRMESLMLASQLRSEIGFHPPNSYISSSLILEAITPPICREDFSLERLEYLGDSVLKYVVSSYLYLKCPEKNKMQLSSTRYLSIRNDTLHKQGLNCNVQLYIRHGTFDPLRWVAPGQFIVHPLPCKCEVENSSLPFQILEKNDNFIVLGKVCDSGHKWMCSKTISDCVEALIGAYYVGGGLTASIAVLKWLDIDVEVNTEPVEKFLWSIPSWISVSIDNEIGLLESKLGYEFRAKGLLLEAITHSSQKDIGASYCYERLEFLGDAVLELLITWYLFKKYKDMNPGELSELRSASFNYERVAHCVAKHKLDKHLQCCSKLLSTQITEYVLTLEEARQDDYMPSSEAHEVLGAMARSIAGAILMDTRFDMIKVWEVIKPLLSPMVTPDKLQLRPARELTEFLDHHGYSSNTQYTMQGEMVIVEFRVQLGSVCLAKIGRGKDRKGARAQAAFQLLKELKKRGIYPKPSRSQQFDGKSSTDLNISVRPRDSETDESKN